VWHYLSYISIKTRFIPALLFTFLYKQLLSLCLWHYYNYCSINTRYVTVFHFTSQGTQLMSLCMWLYYSYCSINTSYIPVLLFNSPVYNFSQYTCSIITVDVQSINAMYRYSPSLPTIYNN